MFEVGLPLYFYSFLTGELYFCLVGHPGVNLFQDESDIESGFNVVFRWMKTIAQNEFSQPSCQNKWVTEVTHSFYSGVNRIAIRLLSNRAYTLRINGAINHLS